MEREQNNQNTPIDDLSGCFFRTFNHVHKIEISFLAMRPLGAIRPREFATGERSPRNRANSKVLVV
jgi:hypothetical protein